MTFLATYLFIGFVICLWVHVRGPRAGEDFGAILSVFDERSWLIALFWPIWLLIYAIERSFPKEEKMQGIRSPSLVGLTGVVVSELRPLGRVRIAGQVVDARAETGVIPAGTPVFVLSRTKNEYIVKQEANKVPQPTPVSRRG